MRVEELMTKGVVAMPADSTVGEARRQMESLDVHALPVTDAEGRLVGIVAPDDVMRGHEPTLPVSRVMTTSVHTLPPDAPLSSAARMMRQHRHHHIVVLDGQSIVGMLSSLDLLKQLE